jgi:hypothetical protein
MMMRSSSSPHGIDARLRDGAKRTAGLALAIGAAHAQTIARRSTLDQPTACI